MKGRLLAPVASMKLKVESWPGHAGLKGRVLLWRRSNTKGRGRAHDQQYNIQLSAI